MTGHQQNPTTGYNIQRGEPAGKIDLEALCRAVGFARVRVVDPYDLKEMDRVLKEELAARGALCDHHPPSLRHAEGRKALRRRP